MASTPHVAPFDQLDPRTLYGLLRLRGDVFVVEQGDPYPDLDGRDLEPGARHLWFDQFDAPVAYLRVLAEPDGSARIGRVCTAPAARGQGLSGRLLTAALELIGPVACVLSAQTHVAGFYSRFGFDPAGPEYLDGSIPHLPMRREPERS